MINAPRKPLSRPQHNPLDGLDLDRLESLLTDLESEHQHLLDLAGMQRDAITRADPRGLSEVVEQTAETLHRIATIEQTRRKAIARPDGSFPTVAEITKHAEPDHAKTLSDRSQSLRKLMHQVQEEHEAVRIASIALSNHMNGLIEQVSSKLSHTGTYGRLGKVDRGRNQVVSSLDTSS